MICRQYEDLIILLPEKHNFGVLDLYDARGVTILGFLFRYFPLITPLHGLASVQRFCILLLTWFHFHDLKWLI